jgi:hypothetical protein
VLIGDVMKHFNKDMPVKDFIMPLLTATKFISFLSLTSGKKDLLKSIAQFKKIFYPYTQNQSLGQSR